MQNPGPKLISVTGKVKLFNIKLSFFSTLRIVKDRISVAEQYICPTSFFLQFFIRIQNPNLDPCFILFILARKTYMDPIESGSPTLQGMFFIATKI